MSAMPSYRCRFQHIKIISDFKFLKSFTSFTLIYAWVSWKKLNPSTDKILWNNPIKIKKYIFLVYTFSFIWKLKATLFACGNDYRRRNIAYVTPDDFHPCINIAFSHINDLGGTVTMLWFQGYFLQVMFAMLIDIFATCSVKNMTIPYKSWLPYLQGYAVFC